jgi:L-alanine-DL-glutamate epimerase-like enolase superfamily enzyme
MKITQIQTLLLSRMHEPARQWFTASGRTIKADCVIVLIQTDEGLSGLGEACPYGDPVLIKQTVAWLAPELVGRHPLQAGLGFHPNGSRVSTDYPFLSPYDCAVAALDTALWDLRGQLENKSVARLLNAQPLERVRLYASSGCRYDWRVQPEQVIEEALDYLAQGFSGYKVRLGTHWQWDGVTPERFLTLMGELAQTLKGRMELMVDGNHRLNLEQAITVAKGLERLGFSWFEEPLLLSDLAGYRQLRAATDLLISGGEQFTTLEQFRPFLESRALSIIQPDVSCAGLTETMRIAEVAERYNIEVCPHNWHNGIMTLANAHLVAALPRPHFLELCMVQGPLQWEILTEKPLIEDGHLVLPQRPGLGAILADDLEERFSFIEGHYAIGIVR